MVGAGLLAGGMATPGFSQESTQPFILGSRSFVIPFTVDANSDQRAKVELLVAEMARETPDQWQTLQASGDRDVQWTPAAMGSTDRPEPFSFTVPSDGEFWFTTRTIQPGQPPRSIDSNSPGGVLKILIDTKPPEIKIVADADGDGTIRADVVIQDATEISEVDVRYVTNVDKEQWKFVPYHPSGSMKFKPAGRWDEAAVVITALDSAGNKQSARQFVRCPRVAEVPVERYAALPQRGYDARPAPYRAGPSPSPSAAAPSSQSASDKTVAKTVAARTDLALPPPATPEQVGLGFASPDTRQEKPAVAPERIGSGLPQIDRRPEIALPAPFPGIFSGSNVPPPQPRRRPSSVADAIKPIDAPSAVPRGTASIGADASGRQTLDGPGGLDNRPGAGLFRGGAGLSGIGSSGSNAGSPNAMAETIEAGRPRIDDDSPAPSASGLSEVDAMADVNGMANLDSTSDPIRRAARMSQEDLDTMMQRVPIRYSDSNRFSLDYEVEALGSRGVDAIELYGTVDRGQSWSLWGSDPDRTTPFDIEVRDDGLFGFRIVVVGQSGLNSPRPLAGEEPDILVLVDRDQPTARITGAKYGVGDEVGSLVIRYECADEHLTQRPITLAFSESIDGPWTTIAGGLQNDGRYVWPADPQLPRAFFLRVDAVDKSGNVGTHVLDRPIDAQGLAPRAKIRGFRSL